MLMTGNGMRQATQGTRFLRFSNPIDMQFNLRKHLSAALLDGRCQTDQWPVCLQTAQIIQKILLPALKYTLALYVNGPRLWQLSDFWILPSKNASSLMSRNTLRTTLTLSKMSFCIVQNPNQWELGLLIWISCGYVCYEWSVQAIYWYLLCSQKYSTYSGGTSESGLQVRFENSIVSS